MRQKTGDPVDRRQETGDRRQETGDRRQETGDRRQETGDTGDTGDRRHETQETGDRRQTISGRGVWGGAVGPPKPTAGARKLAGRRPANFSSFICLHSSLINPK